MEDKLLSRAVTVRDPVVAAVLCDPKLRRIVLSFAAGPRSLSEVSAALGQDLKRLHYHAGKFCRLGLLRIVGERRRAGRSIKLYQASSASFFVPNEVAPASAGDRLLRELGGLLTKHRSGRRGMLFSIGADGRAEARAIVDDDADTGPVEIWQLLKLGPGQAQGLGRDLKTLLKRYEGVSGPGSRSYLMHVALVER